MSFKAQSLVSIGPFALFVCPPPLPINETSVLQCQKLTSAKTTGGQKNEPIIGLRLGLEKNYDYYPCWLWIVVLKWLAPKTLSKPWPCNYVKMPLEHEQSP